MVFANIEYLFLLVLAYTLYSMVYHEGGRIVKPRFRFQMLVYMRIPQSYKNYLLHAPFALR